MEFPLDPAALRWALLGAAVLLAVAFGVLRRRTDGRARAVDHGPTLTADDVGAPLGERVTLLQISTEVCQPCRAARRVLGGLAQELPGVAHIEVKAERDVELVRRLDVTRTPTLLVLDAAGRVVERAHGVPTRDQVLAAIRPHLPASVREPSTWESR